MSAHYSKPLSRLGKCDSSVRLKDDKDSQNNFKGSRNSDSGILDCNDLFFVIVPKAQGKPGPI